MTLYASQAFAAPSSASKLSAIHPKAAIFADPKSQALMKYIERVAPSEATVLIVGETGTGKELVARHLHRHSGRRGAFVAVNCGALSPTLAESELFGHQAGSFTGARENRIGWFESANGGTLFLDEIGDLPLALQVKVLRVLQEREVVRIGARKPIPLDIRLVAATNIDLAQAIAAGTFRADLYYRLNVAAVDLLPLRARRDDILPLADYFLRYYANRLQREAPVLSAEARQALLNYPWPGNIRELENVIHVALLSAADNAALHAHDLKFAPPVQHTSLAANVRHRASQAADASVDGIATHLDRLLASPPAELYQTLEQLIIERAFSYCNNNQVQTARTLGISRNILRTQLKRFGLISAEPSIAQFDDRLF